MAKKQAAPVNTKATKFVTLGQKRVGNAINKVRLIRNLANRTSYDFDADQAAKIVAALRSEVDAVEAKFKAALSAPAAKAASAEPSFTF